MFVACSDELCRVVGWFVFMGATAGIIVEESVGSKLCHDDVMNESELAVVRVLVCFGARAGYALVGAVRNIGGGFAVVLFGHTFS